jgi:ankyrin repeat protein
MLKAVVKGDNETLESLVDEDGGNIHFQMGEYEASLLHEAAYHGNVRGVEFLLAKGINASVKDNRGRTPFHYTLQDAFTDERAKIAKLLLSHGAGMEEKCNDGDTPLHHAACQSSPDAVQLLLSLGANVNAKDINGNAPLHQAACHSSQEMVK